LVNPASSSPGPTKITPSESARANSTAAKSSVVILAANAAGGGPSRSGTPHPLAWVSRLLLTSPSPMSSAASTPTWSPSHAGNTTSGEAQADCVGSVIESYTDTQIVLAYGNVYDQSLPKNMYAPRNGDPLKVVVKGAIFTAAVAGLG